jgi:signal transduction histidine kinase
MAQRAIDFLRISRPSQPFSPATPTLGLRGGLGKTLLIAFLLLAIVPLSLLAFLTYNRVQRDTGANLTTSLENIVALKEVHLLDWVASYQRELGLVASLPDLPGHLPDRLATMQAADPTLTALILLDEKTGAVTSAPASASALVNEEWPAPTSRSNLLILPAPASGIGTGEITSGEPLLAVRCAWANQQLWGLLRWDSLHRVLRVADGAEEGIATWLATADVLVAPNGEATSLPATRDETQTAGIAQALTGNSGAGAYTGLEGEPVFGAYRWIPELGVALAAEYPQAQALASGNTVTAMIIAVTLAVALITAAIAAVVTRRVTRPIVQLTQTAAWMARGDLNQQVTITRRDEIGVLARAFNRMAAELRVLYGELEAKVIERTQQLEEAHERTSYYAMQLSISAEVGRIVTSIRDVDALLSTVAQLIGSAFELQHASIYLLNGDGWQVVWQAGDNHLPPTPSRVEVGSPTLVGQVAADGQRRIARYPAPPGPGAAASEMALPIRTRQRVLGVLHLKSVRPNDFDANDEMVFQSLADQVGIALENARAYALEHQTVERLQELDRIQSQFLTNMSHALRTPLNSVIGFSRLMLRELDGPLSDIQRDDLTTIYESGRQLLGLINDMLELTQLELGTAPFILAEVDLAEIVEGVMATARALAMSKPVQLYEQVPRDLPLLYTDRQRVRQVILALLSNAVKYTDEGSIRLLVSCDDGHVTISVHDTGIGIPPEEQNRILAERQPDPAGGLTATPGFGLAISKRVVERLGGQIWVKSEEGMGATFTFTLPIESVNTVQNELEA